LANQKENDLGFLFDFGIIELDEFLTNFKQKYQNLRNFGADTKPNIWDVNLWRNFNALGTITIGSFIDIWESLGIQVQR
jgi:hypothetical protein